MKTIFVIDNDGRYHVRVTQDKIIVYESDEEEIDCKGPEITD